MKTRLSNAVRVRRGKNKAGYEPQVIKRIIDQSLLCHVAQLDNDMPIVTPTCHWRDGNYLYWHGHKKARNTSGSQGQQVCINICQLDGLVLARSAFHHSVNYRSVTLLGHSESVEDDAEKARQLAHFVERLSPNRWHQLRPMTEQELAMTAVMRISITQASAKVRTGPPIDDANDDQWPVWAGVIPLEKQWGKAISDSDTPSGSLPIPPEAN